MLPGRRSSTLALEPEAFPSPLASLSSPSAPSVRRRILDAHRSRPASTYPSLAMKFVEDLRFWAKLKLKPPFQLQPLTKHLTRSQLLPISFSSSLRRISTGTSPAPPPIAANLIDFWWKAVRKTVVT
ncbi:hypothetical protein V2J09_022138 [Rumex salicifolius]